MVINALKKAFKVAKPQIVWIQLNPNLNHQRNVGKSRTFDGIRALEMVELEKEK